MKRLEIGLLIIFLLTTAVEAVQEDHGFHMMGSYALAAQYGTTNAAMIGLAKEAFDRNFDWEDVGANFLGLILHSMGGVQKVSIVRWEPLPVTEQDFDTIVLEALTMSHGKNCSCIVCAQQ